MCDILTQIIKTNRITFYLKTSSYEAPRTSAHENFYPAGTEMSQKRRKNVLFLVSKAS